MTSAALKYPQLNYTVDEQALLLDLMSESQEDKAEYQDNEYFTDWDSKQERDIFSSHSLHGFQVG